MVLRKGTLELPPPCVALGVGSLTTPTGLFEGKGDQLRSCHPFLRLRHLVTSDSLFLFFLPLPLVRSAPQFGLWGAPDQR